MRRVIFHRLPPCTDCFVFLQGRVRVLRRAPDAAARRRQQLAQFRGRPAHVPAHEEDIYVVF
jgi:hypothetical protein